MAKVADWERPKLRWLAVHQGIGTRLSRVQWLIWLVHAAHLLVIVSLFKCLRRRL